MDSLSKISTPCLEHPPLRSFSQTLPQLSTALLHHGRGSVLCFNSLLGTACPLPTQISLWVFGECFFSLGGPAHQSVDFGFKSFLPFGQLFSHLLHWAVPPAPPAHALCQTLTLAEKQKAACCPPWMSPSLGSVNKSTGMLRESKAIIFPPKGKKIHNTFMAVPK